VGVSQQSTGTQSLKERRPTSAIDTLPPVTIVSLRVAQFIARQKPFVADFNVPIAAIENENLRDCTGPEAVIGEWLVSGRELWCVKWY